MSICASRRLRTWLARCSVSRVNCAWTRNSSQTSTCRTAKARIASASPSGMATPSRRPSQSAEGRPNSTNISGAMTITPSVSPSHHVHQLNAISWVVMIPAAWRAGTDSDALTSEPIGATSTRKRTMVRGESRRLGKPISHRASQAPAAACSTAPNVGISRPASGAWLIPTARCAMNWTTRAPARMPGQTRAPKISMADSAMPAGGNAGVV